MLPLLRAVELDLVVEQDGHQATLQAQDGNFLVTFPTLRSLLHFARELWPQRHQMPMGITVAIRWRALHWRIVR